MSLTFAIFSWELKVAYIDVYCRFIPLAAMGNDVLRVTVPKLPSDLNGEGEA